MPLYYSLKENPCHKTGSMGKKNAEEMLFWTKEEFSTFIEAVMDKPASYTIFMTLYYTNMQEGELLALTPADIDLEKSTIRINGCCDYPKDTEEQSRNHHSCWSL